MNARELAADVLAGGPRGVGRAISCVERGGEAAAALIHEIYPHTGRAQVLGLTGAPGAGKSTLVLQLVRNFRKDGWKAGVIAVDPSSPFSGGAILGDRIRMAEVYTDPGVFIRSMATRGALGGLSRSTLDAVDVLDAARFDVILIETVGVGQDEVDVVRVADSIGVVVVPGLGDDIQAIKAGIFEIADLFIVNKADRDGADRTVAELSASLDFDPAMGPWRPPIVKAVATRGEGIAGVMEAFGRHRTHLAAQGRLEARRLTRARARLRALLEAKFFRQVEADSFNPDGLEDAAVEVAGRATDPYAAAARLFERFARP